MPGGDGELPRERLGQHAAQHARRGVERESSGKGGRHGEVLVLVHHGRHGEREVDPTLHRRDGIAQHGGRRLRVAAHGDLADGHLRACRLYK